MDLALEEHVLEVGESKAMICWIRTSTWREILNVEVWVIRKVQQRLHDLAESVK